MGCGVICSAEAPSNPEAKATVLLVVGAAGEEEYGKKFENWAAAWQKAAAAGGAKEITIGLQRTTETNDLELVRRALSDEPKEGNAELWLVLIGHGTFDGKDAKFNLRGPDLSATNLAAWLQPIHRPTTVINCASSSGAFLPVLSMNGRVVMVATKSGHEINYTRFGQYLSEAILDPQADLDKDGQTSLLEAFLTASHRVAEFYKAEGRLATEHALVDDNGDGLGTPADWFRGIRAVKKAAEGASLDGLRAQQFHLVRSEAEQKMPTALRAKRDELELAIGHLRETKSGFSEDEYYKRLESLLVELAQVYEQRDGEQGREQKQ